MNESEEAGNLRVEDLGDGVGLVEIRRPPANLIDADLLIGIVAGLRELDAAGCRAVLLAGSGKHFCAGINLAAGGPGHGTVAADGTGIYDAALELLAQPLPLVAVVQGAAIGAGLGLALCADFRVATPDARFAATWAKLGTHPGFGVTALLPRLVGPQLTAEMCLSGRAVRGPEALATGLCDRLADAGSQRDAATELAASIAASAPLAVRSVRQTLRSCLVDDVRVALGRERSEQDRLMGTADYAEGLAAAREKRAPSFTAR